MADTLRVKRGQVKGKLTRFQSHFDSIDKNSINDSIISQLQLRLEKIECCWDEFNDLQAELEIVAPSESDAIEREQFEQAFFDIISRSKDIISNYNGENRELRHSNSSNSSIVASDNSRHSNNAFVKLPTIKLPIFDGHYQNWLEFKDIFNAIVNENLSLSQIQKFYYLRSSLGKEPSEVIKSLDVTSANYENAWSLLIDRYENKNLMIHNHIKAIFEYPCVTKESHIELRKLFDNITKHLRSLNTLGENTEAWDRLIIFILSSKLDSVTKRDWEAYKYDGNIPTMADMNKFLKERCEMLEKLENGKLVSGIQKFSRSRGTSNSLVTNTSSLKCYLCKESHAIYNCMSLLNLPVEKRIEEVKKSNLCINCLKPAHKSWQCKAKRCFKCKKLHNSLLHLESPIITKDNINSEQDLDETHPATKDVANFTYNQRVSINQVLLSTALVKIRVKDKVFKARVLLDSGSQSNFVTQELCDKLNLQTVPIEHTVKGVGQHITKINTQAGLNFMSNDGSFTMDVKCLVISKITDKLPAKSFESSALILPKDLVLADPTFNISAEIDILLGSHVFWSIICSGQRILGKNMPVLQNTRLGWILAGNLCSNIGSSMSHLNLDVFERINANLSKFWLIEEVDSKPKLLSKEEIYCEEHFDKSVKRHIDGKFIVNIPFKGSVENLGNSRNIALHRFYKLERRLRNESELNSQYTEFMQEYQRLGHMVEIEEKSEQMQSCYLPHHAVIKQSSITTRCRVVFDASCKTESGLSLNDVQYTGPALQNDIVDILLRFRRYRYVTTADISKMYRQILIEPEQRRYQRIFWRPNPDEKLKCFELNTVTYGTASAPYLAVKCLRQIAKEIRESHPSISKIIANDFYVDDLLTGTDSLEELVGVQGQVTKILASYGFELRKWFCNDINVTNKFVFNKGLDANIIHIGENEANKTLGVYWNANADVIQYLIGDVKRHVTLNKRHILSTICQIFDPLGLLAPVIIIAKLIIQELWKQKLSWDEEVPVNIKKLWLGFQKELACLNELKIPRHCLISEYVLLELHGFSDASEKAYGACLYLRSFYPNKGYFSSLLHAKTRVAPLKTVSLPRLELCGAMLLANLAKKAANALEMSFNERCLWTDSTITLAWIKSDPSRWKPFVANRVSEIHSLSNASEWYHVRSEDNPADLLSRGVNPRFISKENLWWHGPHWLTLCKSTWNQGRTEMVDNMPEERAVSNVLMVLSDTSIFNELIAKLSCLNRLLHVTAYVVRYTKNLRMKADKRYLGELLPEELDYALLMLVRAVQVECFKREYSCLLAGKELDNKSTILSLNPFLHNGVIRVGGRLQNSKLPFESKHQLILPKKHALTDLILRHEHKRLLHCGVQILLYAVREKFWPLSARNSCKRIIRSCMKCFKVKPSDTSYLMGNLPEFRVNEYLPFTNVGVDYGGPFSIKDRKGREQSIIKEKLVNERINWHFIPARSPTFGGIWEAGIKSTKFHLKRVVGNAILTFEEFCTVLTQIEGILNSRPLCPFSNDPNDLVAITPGHILIGRTLTALPEPSYTSIPENRLTSYQRLQAIRQHFWVRWSKEYLTELQTRVKWKRNSKHLLQLGSLVLLKTENQPPQNWPLGRVTKLYPGGDGVCRVVDVQVQRGILKRAVNKVCVLPIEY